MLIIKLDILLLIAHTRYNGCGAPCSRNSVRDNGIDISILSYIRVKLDRRDYKEIILTNNDVEYYTSMRELEWGLSHSCTHIPTA